MKLEHQVCDLIRAKRLKELGVTQNINLFYYSSHPSNIYLQLVVASDSALYVIKGDLLKNNFNGFVSAFTVAELSIMLLEYAETYFTKKNTWRLLGADLDFVTQAESSGHRLISLIENNILDINEVNNRLTK